MILRGVLLLLVLLLSTGCAAPPFEHTFELELESPPLDRPFPPGQGPRERQEIQLLEAYPVGAWITDIRLEGDQALEGATLSFVYPERHYRKLNLEQGPAEFWQYSDASEFGEGGLPVRSNEPLWLELRWNKVDLYAEPAIHKAKLTIEWSKYPVERNLRPQLEGEELQYVPDKFMGFPEKLY